MAGRSSIREVEGGWSSEEENASAATVSTSPRVVVGVGRRRGLTSPSPQQSKQSQPWQSPVVVGAATSPRTVKLGHAKLQRKSRRQKPVSPYRVGTRCWAEWDEDKLWYRAEIVAETLEDGNCWTVVFTDYGNMQVCSKNQLRPLDDQMMLGLAGVDLGTLSSKVDRSSRPISVAVSKAVMLETLQKEEEEARRQEAQWNVLRQKAAKKQEARMKAKEEAEAIAAAIAQATLEAQAKAAANLVRDDEAELPPRCSLLLTDEVELAPIESSIGSESLQATLLQKEVESIAQEIEVAVNEASMVPPSRPLPVEPDSDSDEEEASSREDEGDQKESHKTFPKVVVERNQQEEEEEEEGNDDEEEEWSSEEALAAELYEQARYNDCLILVDREMGEMRAQGELTEEYVERCFIKGKCLIKLGDVKGGVNVFDYAENLCQMQFGESSYLYVQSLVLKSKALSILGDFDGSMALTKRVCQLVQNLKSQ